MKRTISNVRKAFSRRRRHRRENADSSSSMVSDVNGVNGVNGENGENGENGVNTHHISKKSLGDLDMLCYDIIVQILGYLNLDSLLIIMQVCKKFYEYVVELKLLTTTKFERNTFFAPNNGIPNAMETLANHRNKEALFVRGLVRFMNCRVVDACKDFNIYFNEYNGSPYFYADGICVLGVAIVEYHGVDHYAILYIHRVECYHLRLTICTEDEHVHEIDDELLWLCCEKISKFDPQIIENNVKIADSESCASYRKELPGEHSIKLRSASIILDTIRTEAKDFYFNIFMIELSDSENNVYFTQSNNGSFNSFSSLEYSDSEFSYSGS